jgi:hypothetical protein
MNPFGNPVEETEGTSQLSDSRGFAAWKNESIYSFDLSEALDWDRFHSALC